MHLMLTKIPAGLRAMLATYGDPSAPGFAARNLITFALPYQLMYAGKPVTRATCHRLVVDNFVQAFVGVQKAGYADQFREFNGIYAYRPIRGMSAHLSAHAWGIAIDMEASHYPLGSHKRMPDAIVTAFTDCGFEYGGDFVHRPDGMHFQLCRNY